LVFPLQSWRFFAQLDKHFDILIEYSIITDINAYNIIEFCYLKY
jgi:hypothetical protein